MEHKFGPPPPPPKESAPEFKSFEEQASKIFSKCLTPYHAKDPVVLKFILAYVAEYHVGTAASQAGITTQEGKNLLKYADIDKAVQELTALSAIKFGYNVEEAVERAKEINDIDITDIYNEDGTFKHPKEWSASMRRAVKKIKIRNVLEKDPNGMETGRTIGEVFEVEFYEKYEAMKMLAQEKGHFKKQTTVTHDIAKNMGNILLGLKSSESRAIEYMRDVTRSDDDE